jgi:hypothetical protein
MLYGCPNIHVFTDHKNTTFDCLQTQHVLRWHLFLDDYSVIFHYIQGNSYSLRNTLSCLPFDERQNTYALPSHDYGYTYKPNTQAITGSCQRVLNDDLVCLQPTLSSEDTHDSYPMSEDTHDICHQLYGSIDQFQSLALEHNLVDCFIHLPMLENIPFILTYANITQAQPGDTQLQLCAHRSPIVYPETIGTKIYPYGAIKKPIINPGTFTCHVECSNAP